MLGYLKLAVLFMIAVPFCATAAALAGGWRWEPMLTGGAVGILFAFVLSGNGGEWTDWLFPPGEDPETKAAGEGR